MRLIRHCALYLAVLAAVFIVCDLQTVTVSAYENYIVVVDPGHGGPYTEPDSNSGCVANGLAEKDVNLITAAELANELAQYGNVTVFMTRTDDRQLSLDERAQFAKDAGADLLVSVHYNASAEHNFFGSEIFTSAFGDCFAKGYSAAQCIMQQWATDGNKVKGIKTRIGNQGTDYYGVIRHGTEFGIPTIILEHGYLDNDKDIAKFGTEETWRRMGILDATGIAQYLGIQKNVVAAEVSPHLTVAAPDGPVLPDSTPPEGINLVVTGYDSKTGKLDYQLYGSDNESRIIYYGFKTGDISEETVYDKLEYWESPEGLVSGSVTLESGYTGPITARVYNAYELHTDSNTVILTASENDTDEDGSNASASSTLPDDGNSEYEDADDVPGDGPAEKEIIIGVGANAASPKNVDDAELKAKADSKVNRALVGLVAVGALIALGAMIVIGVVASQLGRRD